MVSGFGRLEDLCEFRVDAVAGMRISGEPHVTSKFGLGCTPMQELPESTHEGEEIQSLKYSCSKAFEEDCSPAGSPRPLLAKLLRKRLLRIGHLFLGSLCCNACSTCQKIPLCVLQAASNADTGAAAGESIWQGPAKIRPNLQTPLFSSALRICAETKILKH